MAADGKQWDPGLELLGKAQSTGLVLASGLQQGPEPPRWVREAGVNLPALCVGGGTGLDPVHSCKAIQSIHR